MLSSGVLVADLVRELLGIVDGSHEVLRHVGTGGIARNLGRSVDNVLCLSLNRSRVGAYALDNRRNVALVGFQKSREHVYGSHGRSLGIGSDSHGCLQRLRSRIRELVWTHVHHSLDLNSFYDISIPH